MKVCLKLLSAGSKYKSLFRTEVRILSELCHYNLPWLHSFIDSSNKTAIVMTLHPYTDGNSKPLNVHNALLKHQCENKLSVQDWRQVLLGCTSALVYLKTKSILHNDIKNDNVLVERVSDHEIRAVIIDFNKACFLHEGHLYQLTPEQKMKYSKYHPQIAPEVCNGFQKQSFASDIYAFGRVLQKINSVALKVPCIGSLSLLCLSEVYLKRPSANELHTFCTNLFC